MAEVLSNTDRMTGSFAGVSTEAKYTIDNAKAKITIIDNEKIAFDEALQNIDQDLLTTIDKTNDTLKKVKEEYQKRIDVQGCKSDLFWRVIGITTVASGGGGAGGYRTQMTLKCTRLSVTYPSLSNVSSGSSLSVVGFETGKMMRYTPTQGGIGTGAPNIEVVDMGDGDQLNSDGSSWDQYLQPDNLHGMKLYREPYDRDITDLFVATGVGTIGVNSNDIILLTTNLNLGIEEGQLVTTTGS